MEASIGVNLRVTAHSNQGGRRYMEDMFCVAYQPTTDERDLLYAYFGIFDGHGGRDAALYAKTHLMDEIVSQKNFWADDDESVLRAIRDGFINTHYAMWKELEMWPKTQSGLPSTSGTTASVAFVRRGKLYIGHVGDSAIVLGYQDPTSGYWRARPLTKDHKPENAAENARITQCGGKVISKSGVPRVVWNRPRIGHKGPVRRSTPIDEIPFLAVARSLGDLWSYNSTQNEFVVSPVPDVSVIDIDVTRHRCLILGSDGLWNMLSCQDAVNGVYFAEKNNERQLLAAPPHVSSSQVKNWINPSKRLVDRALDKWCQHNLRADNTSVVTVVIDPPGPPKAQVLRQNQRQMFQQSNVPAVDSTSARSHSGTSTSATNNSATYRTSRPVTSNPIIPPNYHTNYHRGPARHITPSSSAGSIGDRKLPRPVTVDPGKARSSNQVSQAQRSVEQSSSAKSRMLLKRKSETVSKHPTKHPAMMKMPSVNVMRYVGPSALPASQAPEIVPLESTRYHSNSKDDVQIHEISSSSETKSNQSSSKGTTSKFNKIQRVAKTAKPPQEMGKRLTRHTSQSLSSVPVLNEPQPEPVQPVERVERSVRRPKVKHIVATKRHFRGRVKSTKIKTTAIIKSTKTTGRRGRSKPATSPSQSTPACVPKNDESGSNARNLRSASKRKIRVTRSMRRK